MGEGRGLDILFVTFDVILDDMKGILVCDLCLGTHSLGLAQPHRLSHLFLRL